MSKRGKPRVQRRRLPKRTRAVPGTSPGTLVAAKGAEPSAAHVISYGADDMEEVSGRPVAELIALRGRRPVTWINVDGLADTNLIRELGEHFGLHPLALEDVVNRHQRPKVDDYGDNLYIVLRMPSLTDGVLEQEQVSLFVGDDFVVTFQEKAGDCLAPVRQRIRAGRHRIRSSGPDYLAYAMLDAVVDHFFPILDQYGDRLEELETHVLEMSSPPSGRAHALRHDLLALRRTLWPLREMLSALTRGEATQIKDDTRLFIRDCHDHSAQLVDMLESLRDLVSSLADLQLSSLSHRMNDIMRVLTLIATVFMPLGFIAGVFGMNFDREASGWNMPELGLEFGYPLALGLMALTSLGFLWFFRRKGWIGSADRATPNDEP